jgi:glycosyltransferase involved in cell wall biosynthesis
MLSPQESLRIAVLLPARNASDLLPRYFEGVRPFCYAILALDDGSTDDTAAILASEPLVKKVLSNPRRPTYRGWDDSRNRQSLLNACEDVAPNWVLWLDADEFVPECDIALLLKFLRTQATAQQVYGLEVLRMIRDIRHFDKNKLWVYRLYAYRPGYVLPATKLHFEPAPLQIPRDNWRRTRLRIAHLAGLTGTLRRARYRKYLEADPEHQWQHSYVELLSEPGHTWELKPLRNDVNILLD